MSYLISLNPLHLENMAHVFQKSEEPCKILRKLVPARVVNVIHAKALPGFVLYVEYSIGKLHLVIRGGECVKV